MCRIEFVIVVVGVLSRCKAAMAARQYSVAEMVVYPVKACKGISVSSAGISSTGN